VRAQASRQRLLQLRALLLEASPRQIRQHGRVRRPGEQGAQDLPPRDAQHVAGHAAQLEVAPFERLVQPIHFRAPRPDQGHPVPGELPQLPRGALGHEARPEQPMTQQVRQPFAVPHVRLAAGHRLDMLGIDQQQRERPFQHVVERLPVHARALHGHVRTLPGRQPVREVQQLGGHGPEGPDRLRRFPRCPGRDPTRHDALLMHIQPAAPLVHHVHRAPPPPQRGGRAGWSRSAESAGRASPTGSNS
jgi:hypothetical protein